MDPNDIRLNDFKDIIEESIVLIDSVLYQEPLESCAQLHSVLST